MKRLADEVLDGIWSDYKAGIAVRNAVRKYGASMSTVTRHTIKLRMNGKLWEKRERMQAERDAGMPVKKIIEGGIPVDKEWLEAYRSNKAEIKELKYKLAHLADDDSLIGNSVILDYHKGYPQPQSVVGRDLNLEQRRRERWEALIGKLQAEVDEVEQWIDGIPDGLTRRCFRMVYVDGLSYRSVGRKLHIDWSYVGKKIGRYLQLSTDSTDSTL